MFIFFGIVAGDTGMFSAYGMLNFLDVSANLGIIAIAAAMLMIGGEFDLEIHGPMAQPERRYKTFSGAAGYGHKDNEKKGKISVNDALFFQSDYWHRVRPVRKGIRKSLVGWVLGPKFK